jgi:hypothetical protein
MTISSLDITSSLENSKTAIGQKIDYTLALVGNFSNDRVTVQIRKSHDDAVEIQQTINITASGYNGSIVNTFDLKTSRGLELCSGVTDGSYYLYAFDTNVPATASASETFEVVLLTSWMLKNVYMAGISFIDFYGAPLEDSVAEMAAELAIGQVEEDLKIFWYPTIVETTPEQSDAERVIPRLTYIRKDVRGIAFIRLPHYHVNNIEYLYGYFANQKSIEIPSEWLQYNSKRGYINIVAASTTNMKLLGAVGTSIVLGSVPESEIPHFWATRYEAGWNECNQAFPKTWLYLLGLKATLNAAPILADALRPGVASLSLSMDGVSESENTTASAIYSLLSSRVERYQKEYDSLIKRTILKYRGWAMTVV